jgi:DNA-binding transcriptional LysR family regulator
MASLETKLGLQLFRRAGRRAYVTDAGRLLQAHATRILKELSDAEHALIDVRGVVAGPLSIAATSTPASYLVPRSLERFLNEHPQITVTLNIFSSPDVELAVMEGRCDLGVMVTQPLATGFLVDDLGPDELVVVAGAQHPLSRKAEISVDELANQRFIMREASSGTRRFIEARLKDIGATLHHVIEVNNNEAIRRLVAYNIGISILSEQAVHAELQTGRLVAVKVSGVRFTRNLMLITCADSNLSPAARAMRAVIIAEATSRPSEL